MSTTPFLVRVGLDKTSIVGSAAVGLAGLWILTLPSDTQSVALPAFALICVTLVLVVTLWKREGVFPVGELGAVCCVATATYSLLPLLSFLLAGMTWGELSDSRLFSYGPGPDDLSGFAWRHVVYLSTFVVAYLYVRGAASMRQMHHLAPERAMTASILFLLTIFTLYFAFLKLYFGVTYSGSYEDLRAGVGVPTQLPYFMQQLSHNLAGIVLVLKQGLLSQCLLRWHVKKWRFVLYVWLPLEAVASVFVMGARTETILLFVSATILYHWLVRPLTPWKVIAIGSVLLIGLLTFGAVRDYGGDTLFNEDGSLWVATNEFQSLFGTAFDLYTRKSLGTLGEVPWQLYVSDLYMVIPSQLLPFEKLEPAEWYLELLGLRGTWQGFMFGVISQAIIGLDWIELILRGGLLGLIFAKIHRWYVRRGSKFWRVMLYLFLCVWSYYTFRGTTFSVVYMVVYRFLPAMLLVRLGRALLRGSSPASAVIARQDRADPLLHP